MPEDRTNAEIVSELEEAYLAVVEEPHEKVG
jgi:hypothetical protein